MFSNKVFASSGGVENIWNEIGDFEVKTFEENRFDKANMSDKINYQFTYDYTILDKVGTNENYIRDAGNPITLYYGISFNESNPNPSIDYVDIQGNVWETISDQFVISMYNFMLCEFEQEFIADPSNVEKRAAWNKIQDELISLPRPSYKIIADHIDHVVSLVGINHVGIGSDFDGIEVTPDGMEDVSMMPKLFDELRHRGYKEADLAKIASGNFFRILK
jgi:hypothetical protein